MSEEAVIEQEGVDTETTTEEQGFSVNMDDFRASLPEDLRNETMIKEAKDIGSIAKIAVDSRKQISQKTEDFINSISTNGDLTALDAAYSKLGWPGADGEYKVERPEAVDGIQYSEDMEKRFLDVAKELRLNSGQVNGIIAMQNEFNKEQLAQNVEEAKQANETLKTDWGNQYESNKNEVKALLEKHGDESLIKLFNETELGSHAGFVKLIHTLGSGLIERGSVGRGDTVRSESIAKNEARQKIADNYNNSEFMKVYTNPKAGKAYDEAQLEMVKLHQVLHGTEAVA